MNPELEKEQLLSDLRLHLSRCASESKDPNLSKVQIEELGTEEIELWGMYRDLLRFVQAHASDVELSTETVAELKKYLDSFTQPTDQISQKEKSSSRMHFVSFINNAIATVRSGLELIKMIPEEWGSYYATFIRLDVEKYK